MVVIRPLSTRLIKPNFHNEEKPWARACLLEEQTQFLFKYLPGPPRDRYHREEG